MSRSSLEELGIETDLPKHHHMALEESRHATFDNWPRNLTQKPEDLVKAGFYYVGKEIDYQYGYGLLVHQKSYYSLHLFIYSLEHVDTFMSLSLQKMPATYK